MASWLKVMLPVVSAVLMLTGLARPQEAAGAAAARAAAAPEGALARVLDQPSLQAGTFFSTGTPDGRIGMASRPGPVSGVNQETEAADDFILSSNGTITGATFTGLLPAGMPLSNIQQVVVEIYRVFPKDSNAARTPNVPTRNN